MTFTVVMPCHNAERWVADALRSARDQTRPPEQIIVVNDASTDASAEAIRSSGVEVELIEADVRNAAAARNLALKRATGEWIAFLDADDMWKAEHLEQAEAILRQGNDVGLTGVSDTLFADGELRPARSYRPRDHPETRLSPETFVQEWMSHRLFSMVNTVVRRDRLQSIGGFNEAQLRRHDFDMWLRLINGHTWAFNPHPTAIYRVTPGSVGRINPANTEFYALQMVLRNIRAYPSLGAAVGSFARRAVASALTDGDAIDLERALHLAKPHLRPWDRVIFGVAMASPPIFRAMNRLRRRLHGLRSIPQEADG